MAADAARFTPRTPGLGGCLGLALRTWRAAPGASPGLLAHAGQLGPGGVEVALGALGPAAQLAARLLEHLRAGFQRSPQLVPLAGRVDPEPLKFGGVCRGHLGEPPGGVGEPGEDLVPFPLSVGAKRRVEMV